MVCGFRVNEGRGRCFEPGSDKEVGGTWMNMTVPGYHIRRWLWGFAQWSDHPWDINAVLRGAKLWPSMS